MTEDKKTHDGYANGSKILDLATVEGAIRRMIGSAKRHEEPQPNGTVLVRTTHETDPPENFFERRTVKRPGPLPSLVAPAEIPKKSIVFEHDHTAFIEAENDMDVWAYHVARWAVLEARRLQAKLISVRSVGPGEDPGTCSIKMAFAK